MIQKFVSWLYLKVVYMPEFKKKMKQAYPDAEIVYTTRTESYDHEMEERILRQACFERERIPNDHLH